MSDNRDHRVALYFTGEVFRRLANQNRGHIRVMLEICVSEFCHDLVYCMQGNQHNRSVMLNSKVIDYINFILRSGEFKNIPQDKVCVKCLCVFLTVVQKLFFFK